MPITYELDVAGEMVRTRGWGVLTEGEAEALYATLRADPAFRPTFRQRCDLREVTQIDATTDALRNLARAKTFAPGAHRAFVVGRDVDYGLARIFQAYSELGDAEMRVFRDWEEAERWVGLR